jgi:hypothetical protein
MLVQFKFGFDLISDALWANWQRVPLLHLFARKNLHISVFASCAACFCRRFDDTASSVIA